MGFWQTTRNFINNVLRRGPKGPDKPTHFSVQLPDAPVLRFHKRREKATVVPKHLRKERRRTRNAMAKQSRRINRAA